ncbi:MAG: TIGR04283 family arsenosugar biosynthesis glycosyltransferase [Roseovarius sp.]
MRAPLSVVIPTLNAADALPACLGTLIEGVDAGLVRELILSDGGSTDATPQIASEVGAQLITGPASRGGQLRRGAQAAAGEWLLFVHADSQVPPGWAALVQAHMTQTTADTPAYFKLRFDQRGFAPRWVAGWANLRARLFRLPYGDQGLLVSRAAYDAAGGYRDIALMEDVTLARALRPAPVALPGVITTSADKYQRDGWLKRGGRNLSLLLRYGLGADPDALARRY